MFKKKGKRKKGGEGVQWLGTQRSPGDIVAFQEFNLALINAEVPTLIPGPEPSLLAGLRSST